MSSSVRKVLLVNIAGHFLTSNSFVPDNSLGALASALLAKGIPTEILDFQGPQQLGEVMDRSPRGHAATVAECVAKGAPLAPDIVRAYHRDRHDAEELVFAERTRALLDKIADEGVGLVGFKLWAGPGLDRSLQMAAAIRRAFPEVCLVGGGPAVLYFGADMGRLARGFDFFVQGDGELVLVELALGAAPGGIRRHGPSGEAILIPPAGDLRPYPFATYAPEVYPNIGSFLAFRVLDESRGCGNRCHFCGHYELNGGRTRVREAHAVVDEMQRLQEHEGVSYFRLSGSNPPPSLLAEIGSEILRRDLRVRYSAYASLAASRPETFPLLFRSGLRSLFFGVEGADPALLRRACGKTNGTLSHVENVARRAMDEGIFTALSFIVPAPFETPETQERSLELIARIFRLSSLGSVLVLPPHLLPRTTWWENRAHFGFEFADGVDESLYVDRLLNAPIDFLLPRDSWKSAGVRLNGREWREILGDCEAFSQKVRELGIVTHLDDASYMLALMANTSPRVFQSAVLDGLLVGGAAHLLSLVARYNRESASVRDLCPAG